MIQMVMLHSSVAEVGRGVFVLAVVLQEYHHR
jgi:hypothetical protein